MMGWTNRHGRYFLNLLSSNLRLWTEMIAAPAVIYGDDALLKGGDKELVLQLGGNKPQQLAEAALRGERAGFGEINLNMGCPSSRVGAGGFGAAMMLDLENAARCVGTMATAVNIPISVKCRIGVDEQEPSDILPLLLEKLSAVGVERFAIHARKAWLKGISPRQNRTLPPLNYQLVYEMKKQFPHLEIILNGGVVDLALAEKHLEQVDAVMIGRAAFRNPYMLTAFNNATPPSRKFLLEKFTEYALREGLTAHHLTHYISGLWSGISGAAYFRRELNEIGKLNNQTATKLLGFSENLIAA